MSELTLAKFARAGKTSSYLWPGGPACYEFSAEGDGVFELFGLAPDGVASFLVASSIDRNAQGEIDLPAGMVYAVTSGFQNIHIQLRTPL